MTPPLQGPRRTPLTKPGVKIKVKPIVGSPDAGVLKVWRMLDLPPKAAYVPVTTGIAKIEFIV